jgi:hypothetical protein
MLEESRTSVWVGRSLRAERWGRPNLVFLCICLVYLGFPSHDFGVDALHYGMRALLTAAGASSLFSDISVPVHLAWHAAAAALLGLTGTPEPLQALYVLGLFDIVVALVSIFLFMGIVRRIAGDFVASCATVVLAFSHACLRFFLSVEVYALNNLALIALVWFVHRRCTTGKDPFGMRQVVVVGLLSMAAITTHLSNLLLVPALVLFFIALDLRRAWWRVAVYLGVVGLLLSLLVAWISSSTSLIPSDAIEYLFGYSSKAHRYVAGGPLQNAMVFLRAVPRAALGSFGPLLYLPLAAFAVWAVRNARALWAHGFFRFLIINLAFVVGFYSQWDAANIEHKIAILPVLLLLVVHSHAALGRRLSRPGRAAALALVGLFVVVGFLQGILPYRHLEDQELYRLSAAINGAAPERAVVVVGLASESKGHPVVMAAMTFFGQRVLLLDATDEGFEERLQAHRDRGIAVLSHEEGRFRPLASPRGVGRPASAARPG